MTFRMVYKSFAPDDLQGSKVKVKTWNFEVEYLENGTR